MSVQLRPLRDIDHLLLWLVSGAPRLVPPSALQFVSAHLAEARKLYRISGLTCGVGCYVVTVYDYAAQVVTSVNLLFSVDFRNEIAFVWQCYPGR